jgi:hypothetical protein
MGQQKRSKTDQKGERNRAPRHIGASSARVFPSDASKNRTADKERRERCCSSEYQGKHWRHLNVVAKTSLPASARTASGFIINFLA